MGEIVNIRCAACGSDWECRVGNGILHGNLTSVADAFSGKQREEIEGYAKQMPAPSYTFSFRTSRCKHCGKIVSIPVLTLPETGAVLTAPCPDCGTKLKPIARLSKSACPVCGKSALESELTGRWD